MYLSCTRSGAEVQTSSTGRPTHQQQVRDKVANPSSGLTLCFSEDTTAHYYDMRIRDAESGVLHARLAELEEQVSRLSKTIISNPCMCGELEPDETELFQRCTDQTKVPSLSSHIYAVRQSLLSVDDTSDRQSPPSQVRTECDDGISADHLQALPTSSELHFLVDLYFEYMHYFFPCIDEGQFRAQLALTCSGCTSQSRPLHENTKIMSATFLMVLYVVLAIGTCLDPKSQKSPSNTVARRRYLEIAFEISRSKHGSGGADADIELLRYQTALAVCLIHIERPTSAYRALSDAVQQAFVCGLNDESLWSCGTTEETHSRRQLWWTIFYLDRRIAQKCWKPYLIRETEVCVDECLGMSGARIASPVDVDMPPQVDHIALVDLYLRSNTHWARLWATVWDTLFSAKAVRVGATLEDLEVLEARIVHAQRQVPPCLKWGTEFAETYATAAEPEVHVRSRLVIYVVSLSQSNTARTAVR